MVGWQGKYSIREKQKQLIPQKEALGSTPSLQWIKLLWQNTKDGEEIPASQWHCKKKTM